MLSSCVLQLVSVPRNSENLLVYETALAKRAFDADILSMHVTKRAEIFFVIKRASPRRGFLVAIGPSF